MSASTHKEDIIRTYGNLSDELNSQQSIDAISNEATSCGSGQFLFPSSNSSHRFICWRVMHDRVDFQELSLHESYQNNTVRMVFPAQIVSSGIHICGGVDEDCVIISVLTVLRVVHRFVYRPNVSERSRLQFKYKNVDQGQFLSIFHLHVQNQWKDAMMTSKDALEKVKGVKNGVVSFEYSYQILTCVASTDAISSSMWIDQYNLIVATLAGQLIAVNYGISQAMEHRSPNIGAKLFSEAQEFVFSDLSIMKRIFRGIFRYSKSKHVRHSFNVKNKRNTAYYNESAELLEDAFPDAIIAMTYIAMSARDPDGDEQDLDLLETLEDKEDVILITLSADLTLAIWSYHDRACVGKQALDGLLLPQNETESSEQSFREYEDTFDNGIVLQAKIEILPQSTCDDCRLLLAYENSDIIYMFRGRLDIASRQLSLEVVRTFTIPNVRHQQCPHFLDFAVHGEQLYSVWYNRTERLICMHPNSLWRTGPRNIPGQLVKTIETDVEKWELDTAKCSDDVCRSLSFAYTIEAEPAILEKIDKLYVKRLLRDSTLFSDSCISKAIADLSDAKRHSSSEIEVSLLSAIKEKWKKAKECNDSKKVELSGAAIVKMRAQIWSNLLKHCSKYHRLEHLFMGFVSAKYASLAEFPILVLENNVSWLWPDSTSVIENYMIDSQNRMAAEPLSREVYKFFQGCFCDSVSEEIENAFSVSPASPLETSPHIVQAIMNIARHHIRRGNGMCQGGGASGSELSMILVRLRAILSGGYQAQISILRELVACLNPKSATRQASNESVPDSEDMTDRDARESDESDCAMDGVSTFKTWQQSDEVLYSFSNLAAQVIDEMTSNSLRVLLLLAYIMEDQPTFLAAETIKCVHEQLSSECVAIYRRWVSCRTIARHKIVSLKTHEIIRSKRLGQGRTELLYCLLQQKHAIWTSNRVCMDAVSAMYNTFGDESTKNDIVPDDVASSMSFLYWGNRANCIGTIAAEIVLMSYNGDKLCLEFLEEKNVYSLMIPLLCNSLLELGTLDSHAEISQPSSNALNLFQKIGECYAREGNLSLQQTYSNSLTLSKDMEKDIPESIFEYAVWCFHQALRCFRFCLPSMVAEEDCIFSGKNTIAKYLRDVIALMKDCMPNSYAEDMLRFLWTVADKFSQDQRVLNDSLHSTHTDSLYTQAWGMYVSQDVKLQMLVWVNIFKYALEVDAFYDAHMALARMMQYKEKDTNASDFTKEQSREAEMLDECVSLLVKRCIQKGRLDILYQLHWGSLEHIVEKQLNWYVEHASLIKRLSECSAVDMDAIGTYRCLYAYYMETNRVINASASMYHLFLRLKWIAPTHMTLARLCLELQFEAIMYCYHALLSIDSRDRSFPRKHLREEFMLQTDGLRNFSHTNLGLVTFADVELELAVLGGKTWLVRHQERVGLTQRATKAQFLYSMDSFAIIALLIDAALYYCQDHTKSHTGFSHGSYTVQEKQRLSWRAIELSCAMILKGTAGHFSQYKNITRSLSRSCANCSGPTALKDESSVAHWTLLQTYLEFRISDTTQWEIAAKTLFDVWRSNGHVDDEDAVKKTSKVLPHWMEEVLMQRNLSLLVKLYIDNGYILEALRVANAMIPMDMTQESEQAFTNRMEGGNAANLPWLPWSAIDALLQAAKNTLKTVENTTPQIGKELDHALSNFQENLCKYFSYTQHLQEAKNVALLL